MEAGPRNRSGSSFQAECKTVEGEARSDQPEGVPLQYCWLEDARKQEFPARFAHIQPQTSHLHV